MRRPAVGIPGVPVAVRRAIGVIRRARARAVVARVRDVRGGPAPSAGIPLAVVGTVASLCCGLRGLGAVISSRMPGSGSAGLGSDGSATGSGSLGSGSLGSGSLGFGGPAPGSSPARWSGMGMPRVTTYETVDCPSINAIMASARAWSRVSERPSLMNSRARASIAAHARMDWVAGRVASHSSTPALLVHRRRHRSVRFFSARAFTASGSTAANAVWTRRLRRAPFSPDGSSTSPARTAGMRCSATTAATSSSTSSSSSQMILARASSRTPSAIAACTAANGPVSLSARSTQCCAACCDTPNDPATRAAASNRA